MHQPNDYKYIYFEIKSSTLQFLGIHDGRDPTTQKVNFKIGFLRDVPSSQLCDILKKQVINRFNSISLVASLQYLTGKIMLKFSYVLIIKN